MNDNKKRATARRGSQLGRKSKNTFVTKSGQTIKINRSLTDRVKARKAEAARRRAERMAGMPKSRVKRFFYRLHPKRMYKYWFSREGGIMALKIAGIGIVAGFLLMIGVFAYFRKDLPNLRDISGNNIGGSIRYYDRSGQTLLWEDYDAVKRIPVQQNDMNQHIRDAAIAIEDKDFFSHGGFDVRGIARAGFNNAFGGDTRQGGSTITQQLVRLTQSSVGREQTYKRKIKEVILSIELERTYSKDEILTGYLNTAPYGNVQYGVEAAMRDYFHKSAKDASLDEAAFLAAMPQAPSFYSPYGPNYDPEALIGRQHYILDLMEQQGMISKEERDEAKQVDTIAKVKPVRPKYSGIKAPWFVLTAKEELEKNYGEQTVQRGGWKVTTTLDMKLQEEAEKQVNDGMAQIRRQGGNSAAFVAEDVKTGQIVALVGGSDFNNEQYGQNNYARYKLPPGSSFKPYDYLALIEHEDNFGAGTVLYDTQGPIPGYPCTNKNHPRRDNNANCLWNFDFRYPGPMTLRYALGGSRNVPAVKAMLIPGVEKTIETANKLMGAEENEGYNCYLDEELTKRGPCYASSAIGDGAYLRADRHVHGYGTISRNGLEIPMTYILKIEDAAGQTVREWTPSKGNQVVRPDSAYIVADMMADPRASYMSRKIHRYNNGQGTWDFSVKTGTTNDNKDGWMMGFSTRYSAGVWVGYHNRRVEMRGFMETMTTPIWNGWMMAAHKDLKPEERQRPSGVQTLPAFVVRSRVGGASSHPSSSTDLFPSWYKRPGRATTEKRVIDIVSNKLATECTPNRAKREINDAAADSFSGDTFTTPGQGGNGTETDDVHKCDDLKPSVRLSVSPIGGGRYRLSADVTKGTHPLSSDRFPGTLTFKINGQTVHTMNVSSPGVYNHDYTPNFSGNRTVTVEIVDSVLYDATDSKSIKGGGNDDDDDDDGDGDGGESGGLGPPFGLGRRS
jgi:membrane peptidoglycan carboxypeptidase